MRHGKAAALLELARHLSASAEGLTLDEMAAAIRVGRRTAERMRDALEMLFPQMETLSEAVVKRYRIPRGLDGFFQAPSREELLELAKAADVLRAAGHESRSQVLASLERKIRTAMKAAAVRRLAPDVEALARAEMSTVHAGPRPVEDAETLATIRQAIMALQALSFRYAGGSRPGQVRVVCPYGILFERMNYLVAAELGSDEPRNWRLDRISDLQITDTPAAPPSSFSLREYAARSFGVYQDQIEEVVLRVLPHAAEEASAWRFHGEQRLEAQADGSVLVRFRSSGMLELAWHLFTWGDKVQVIAPSRLRATLQDALDLAFKALGAGRGDSGNQNEELE